MCPCSCRLSDIFGCFVSSSLRTVPGTSIGILQCARWSAEGGGRLSSGKLRFSLQFQSCKSFLDATPTATCADVQWWPGLLSLKDLAADLFGTVFALSALVTYEAIWGRPFAARLGSSSVA